MNWKMLTILGTFVLLTGLALVSCGNQSYQSSTTTSGSATTAGVSTTAGAGGVQVSLKDFRMDPETVTVQVGQSVTWTNNDSVTHDVVGDNNEFDSGTLAPGATFTFTFESAGTITYHCSIHPSMKATVVVQ
jgi:plastocyanin